LNDLARHGLRHTPRLWAAVCSLRNRWHRRSPVDLLGVAAAILVWLVSLAFLLASRPVTRAAMLAWVFRHRWHLAGPVAVLVASVVSRRRATLRATAPRSWLAALPVTRRRARLEALVIETQPALLTLGLLTVAFATFLGVAAFAVPTVVPRAAAAWSALAGGVLIGAAVSYLVPLPKPVEPTPGSRYVPQRRPTRAAPVVPSLRSLGLWPVRALFAGLRPQAVTRVAIPILLLMPLGTTADVAMLVIGICADLGAMLLLMGAMVRVHGAARRWLRPLPAAPQRLSRQILMRPALVLLGGIAVAAWLLWLVRSSPGTRP
jgi:hypothetical protein